MMKKRMEEDIEKNGEIVRGDVYMGFVVMVFLCVVVFWGGGVE